MSFANSEPKSKFSVPPSIQRSVKVTNFALSVSTVLLLVGWYYGLFVVGADRDQGDVYRIMFVHVPVAWCAFLWVIIGGIFGAMGFVRKTKIEIYDRSSNAAMQLGTVFAALALVTGSMWGRPTWGVWWDWDPRLTSTLIMFLVCCGYHLSRSFTPDINSRRVGAAALAVFSSLNVPVVYYSVNMWRSLHQPQTFVRKQSTASGEISFTLWLNVGLLILFSIILYKTRRQAISGSENLQTARETL